MAEQQGRSRNQEGYGVGTHTLSSVDMLECDPDEMTRRLVATFKSPGYQPPMLPQVAMEVMRLAGQPDVTFPQLVSALSQDPILAGRVLTVAQSPVYARRNPVNSLDEAIARLGIRGLRNIVMEVALNLRVFKAASYADSMETVRRHSLACAHVCHLLAHHLGLDHNEAFLCGMLHDVGMAGGLLVVGDLAKGKAPPPLSRFWYAIESAHAAGSAALCELWGLPKEIQVAVGLHHELRRTTEFDRRACMVCLAEHLVIRLGVKVQGAPHEIQGVPVRGEDTPNTVLNAAMKALGMTGAMLKEAYNQAEDIVALLG